MTLTTATPDGAKRPQRFIVRTKSGEYVGKAELRKVVVHEVKMDHAYQRDTSAAWIADHLPFDPQLAGTVVLSSRAGGPYCIDGGHRIALARESGVSHINAFVIEGLAQRDEARLFTKYQRERRALTSFALYRADIVAGDPDTVAMDRVVHVAGFQIAKNASPNNITAIDSLRYVQRVGGEDLLARTLALIKRFWIGEEKALSGQVIKGVGIFLQFAAGRPSFRQATLDRVMNGVAPVKLLRFAVAVGTKRGAAPAVTAANVADALVEQYDKLVPESDRLGSLTIGSRARPARKWSDQ